MEWSQRVDVYSFGVVLLEVMSGQQPLLRDPEDPNEAIHIVEWVIISIS
jgi:serine/threonine protein kinase